MITCEVTIQNRLGLHARAAAKFVHTATRYAAHIRIGRDHCWMDGKSIMGVLLLAAAQGTTLVISADGPDEVAAVAALAALIQSGFGEEAWNA